MRFLLPALAILVGLLVPELAFAEQALDEALVSVASEVTDVEGGEGASQAVRLLVIFTSLTFLPAVLLVCTPFTRFIIVFSLLRQALGLQQSPPNQVLVGLSLVLSMLVMTPTLEEMNDTAVQPYLAGEMETTVAIEQGMAPLRRFMLANIQADDMQTVAVIGHLEQVDQVEDIPTPAVISAFVLSELKTAFTIAVKVYIPFLVVDIVVASVLLGMGMMVLPPVVISLPFKLLLFVLMDGWGLLVTNMVANLQG
jgi:flagellar biosynthesis protein FliP